MLKGRIKKDQIRKDIIEEIIGIIKDVLEEDE